MPAPLFAASRATYTQRMEWLRNGFRLGECVVQPAEGTITTPEGVRRLGPRPFDVLLFLCAEPGRVWTRAELMSSVWGRVIVSDETLSRCISDLRHAHARHDPVLAALHGHPRFEALLAEARLDAEGPRVSAR